MQVVNVLFIVWGLVILFWVLNHFYYQNVKHELEYRRKRHAELNGPPDA